MTPTDQAFQNAGERSIELESATVQCVAKAERVDKERGIVWGWASSAEVVDLQGELIPTEELEDAVYQFMLDYYAQAADLRDTHQDQIKAVIVESTLEWRAGHLMWWIGVMLLDEELREAARNGEISGFSIGGRAQRVDMEDDTE